MTSSQQARIEENRAAALATRRAKSKAKSNAKAQARRTASSRNQIDEEDIGGEEDITVGEEDITVEGAVVPAPQSRGPISDREMAERDAAERPQCVICQDFLKKMRKRLRLSVAMYSTLGASQLMQRSEISRWRARALSSVGHLRC